MDFYENYNRWIKQKDLDEELKAELDKMSLKEIKEAFSLDLEFGTGGLRGILGAGTNRLNIYTLAKTTRGYAKYLIKKYDENIVVISYDNRYKSKQFANLAAGILAAKGIKVYLFDKLMPTPLLSYAVRFLNATGGIMITASHNPKNYNGFKVYDNTGCQLLPSEADKVIKYIKEIKNEFKYEVANKSTLIQIVPDTVFLSYLNELEKIEYNSDLPKVIKTVFTPLHGTALSVISEVYRKFNYPLLLVEDEMDARSDFGFLNLPNPEEKDVYKNGLDIALDNDCDLVISTDPDADRVGVCVLVDKTPYYLDGNETATLMFYYLVNRLKELKCLKDNSYLFTTLVSSYLPLEIAKQNNIKYDLVLTGFKYIGNKINQIKKKGYNFLFGFEESYGSLLLDSLRDKDAIEASLFITSMANYYKLHGKTLLDVLNEIYFAYGYYMQDIITITAPGLDGIDLMEKAISLLRTSVVNVDTFDLVSKEDYLTLEKLDYKTNKISKLTFESSDVLKFNFNKNDSNYYFIVRRSGTEPKLKVYLGSSNYNKDTLVTELTLFKQLVGKLINSYLGL